MNELYYLEKSSQEIPITNAETNVAIAPSVPLYDLAHDAPQVDLTYDYKTVRFPISNDESAGYFDQTRSRQLTSEYQEATNRTAVVVGESSLAAALQFIPEDTIVMVDYSPEMCVFMQRYIDALRQCETVEQWQEMMQLTGDQYSRHRAMLGKRVIEQMTEWRASGYEHAFGDPEAYYRAHQIAKQKAIIPWCADITKKKDMKKLGKALRSRDANVTMMNITNTMLGQSRFNHSSELAQVLNSLPLTEHAPILATTIHKIPNPIPSNRDFTVAATGPFFGLGNLRKHGGRLDRLHNGDNALVERQYFVENYESGDPLVNEFTETILSALSGVAISGSAAELKDKGYTFGGVLSMGKDGNETIDVSDLPPEIQAVIKDL